MCHPDRKHYAHGQCIQCYQRRLKELNPSYHERQKKGQKRWYGKHKERRRFYSRVSRLRRYGLTVEEYETLLTEQDGVCAICKKAPKKKRLHVDHDHDTGNVRGLLCFNCNFGLSWFKEEPRLLGKAKKYLEASL